MTFLLDTNVVSELRRSTPDRHVLAWYQRNVTAQAYVSVLVLGEIRQRIERTRRRDPAQAEALERWLDRLVLQYRDRILPVTADVVQEWGRLGALSKPPPALNGLMAATARVHRLVLVTRNVGDVAGTGVAVVNPFEPAYPERAAP
jgi:toxin FitB